MTGKPAMLTRTTWRLSTRFGPVAVECTPRGVARLAYLTEEEAATLKTDSPTQEQFLREHAWAADLIDALSAYFAGDPVRFDLYPVDLSEQTPFRRKVLEACRLIPYGQTMTYRDLAAWVGDPSAARAVGSAMSNNPVPIIVPCHRVVRGDGELGGYSAPGGVALKQRLLDMEGSAPAQP